MKYRRDIDGLRSIAVLPVLFFHAGFSIFSGGYVGVDIFFVISGFLITQILIQELAEGRFSILNFYQRRGRRILPALFSVLFITTIISAFIIPPSLYREYGQSLVSVGGFISNIFFYLETGYFGFDAEKMPLLHTWSLAVEEQFYIFVPPLLFVLYRLGLTTLGVIFIIFSIASLFWSQYQLNHQEHGSSFFLIMSRAWELFAGSLIAIYQLDKKKIHPSAAQSASVLGLALILWSIFSYEKTTPFPGLAALPPVLGTFLIISFCRPETLIYKLLALRPMVWIGLISYSLYLVHQPVFALTRYLFVSEPDSAVFVGLIVMSILLAYVNYNYVEQPFRNPNRFSGVFVLKAGISGCVTVIAVGMLIHAKQGFPDRYGQVKLASTIEASPLRKKCHAEGFSLKASDACKLGDSFNKQWAVLGDSHGVELSYELAKLLEKHSTGLVQYTLSGCPPALKHKLKMPACSSWQEDALTAIQADENISTVILVFRVTAFISGKDIMNYPKVPDEDKSAEFELDETDISKERSYELMWENYHYLINALLNAGKRVVVIDPIPELPIDIRQIIYPKELFTWSYHLPMDKTTTVDFYNKRHHYILNKLSTMQPQSSLLRLSALPVFCEKSHCSAVKNNKSLYFDDDHPSLYGAKILAESILFEHKKHFN